MFGRIFHLRFVVGQVFHVCILDEYSLGLDFTELFLNVSFQCPTSNRFDIIREEQTQRCEYIWEVAHEQETHNWAYNGDSHNTTAQKWSPGDLRHRVIARPVQQRVLNSTTRTKHCDCRMLFFT